MIPIIVIEGPTASGKTALAIELANRFKTDVISADSRQVYKFLDIGTAKPTPNELSTVRHHLIDVITPDQTFNVGLFRKSALLISQELRTKGKIPILCGGTGLYVKALLDGLFLSDTHDPIVRAEIEEVYYEKGLQYLYEELVQIDNNAAKNISNKDKQRIMRALEVYQSTGIPISEHWKKQNRDRMFIPFRILVNESREVLYKRINQRVIQMLQMGLIDEIKSILAKGYTWHDPGLNSLGYKEFRSFLEGNSDLKQASMIAQQHSRNYAKRQTTWYRKCNFHLAEPYSSISLSNVEAAIISHFDINTSGISNGNCCTNL